MQSGRQPPSYPVTCNADTSMSKSLDPNTNYRRTIFNRTEFLSAPSSAPTRDPAHRKTSAAPSSANPPPPEQRSPRSTIPLSRCSLLDPNHLHQENSAHLRRLEKSLVEHSWPKDLVSNPGISPKDPPPFGRACCRNPKWSHNGTAFPRKPRPELLLRGLPRCGFRLPVLSPSDGQSPAHARSFLAAPLKAPQPVGTL
jgi:hypothetical protein